MIFLSMISLVLAGCAKQEALQESAQSAPTVSGTQLWVLKQGSLVLIDAATQKEVSNQVVPSDLVPVSFEYGKTFQMSDDAQYIVWFVPAKGLVRFNSKDKSIQVFYQPTAWFYENPYFRFLGKTHELLLVDKKGTEVIKVNLDTNAVANQAIPYPFGTIFHVSPDLEKIVYIEGYQQTTGQPQYLVTSMTGSELSRVTTNTEIADRASLSLQPNQPMLFLIREQFDAYAAEFGYPQAEASSSARLMALAEANLLQSNYETSYKLAKQAHYFDPTDPNPVKMLLTIYQKINRPDYAKDTEAYYQQLTKTNSLR